MRETIEASWAKLLDRSAEAAKFGHTWTYQDHQLVYELYRSLQGKEGAK